MNYVDELHLKYIKICESYGGGDQTTFGSNIPTGPSNGNLPANGPGNASTQPLQSAIPTNGDLVNFEDSDQGVILFKDKISDFVRNLMEKKNNDNSQSRQALLSVLDFIDQYVPQRSYQDPE
tara:strand:- start:166 stop:531 length:366 start_codon:yes stop_codon:yes gene_type:complete